jgi:hypothetical protein
MAILSLIATAAFVFSQAAHSQHGPPTSGGKISGHSSLVIACDGPVELLLADPLDRKLGEDPVAKKAYDELSEGYYESAGIADNETGVSATNPGKVLYLGKPALGLYRLSITGIGRGTYDCKITGSSPAGGRVKTDLKGIPSEPGGVYSFALAFDDASSPPLQVRGALELGSQTKSGGIPLLSYAAPASADVKLAPGKAEFDLLIVYSLQIDPSSFSATLDGRVLTSLFHPKPGSAEFVRVSFRGNTKALVLTARGSGSRASEKVVDKFDVAAAGDSQTAATPQRN